MTIMPAVPAEKVSNGCAFRHHHCPSRRRWAAGAEFQSWIPAPPNSSLARLGLERVEFMEDAGGIAIELGRGHDAEVAVAGLENGDADHEGSREIPCPRVSGLEVVRHRPAPV